MDSINIGLACHSWALRCEEEIREEFIPDGTPIYISINSQILYASQLRTLPNPPFSDDLRQACRTRLLGCLGDLNAHTTIIKSGDRSMKIPAVASNGELWISKVLATIRALEHDTKHVSLINEVDENDLALRAKALGIAVQLKSVSEQYLMKVAPSDCWYRYQMKQQEAQNCCYWELSYSSIAMNPKRLTPVP